MSGTGNNTAIANLNSQITTGSYNNLNYGVVGRTASASCGPFYAYIHNGLPRFQIADDSSWRLVLIFSTRDIADEWWRAVSTSTITQLQNNIQRVTPQFYTHDTRIWNAYNFFTESAVSSVSALFRGKLFLVLENDRGGRGITVVPRQHIVDRTSGNWFCIRSVAEPAQHWFYDPSQGRIYAHPTQRTLFRIMADGLQDGGIMIGSDNVILVAANAGLVSLGVATNSSNPALALTPLQVTNSAANAQVFNFGQLLKGCIASTDQPAPTPLWFISTGGGLEWELVL
ncbi:hypothetical protein BDN72DRAFT_899110 [Pluteus cervinus]|uniref:Uncharacterized protein n=1 Tax=Pluteus cervinus TaxID=181527 RepID=A0ACD3AP59_9AGAR|nr:hypothetical protein BDN72DRAFT_899110 [Pluteus cervinus]